jgi:hypothetical protein
MNDGHTGNMWVRFALLFPERRGSCSDLEPPRSGAALLVVLLLTGLAMAYAYTALRVQAITGAITRNSSLQAAARQAALSGAFLALQYMSTGSWQGVESTFSRPIDDQSSFVAVFRTGDVDLEPADPRYGEYPYRVTVEVVGQARDLVHNDLVSTARLRLVVRLVPRAVSSNPSGWSDLTSYILCQWRAGTCSLQIPFRAVGPIRLRDQLNLGNSIAWSTNARWDYCQGLRFLQLFGLGDYRPFTGPVLLPYSRQASGTISLLQVALGIDTVDSPTTAIYSWRACPAEFAYRLYPGGQVYWADSLSVDQLSNTTIAPDPLRNPLGVRIRQGNLELQANTQIIGSLLFRGGKSKLGVTGPGNRLESPMIPGYQEPIHPREVRVRLPAAVVEESITVESGGELSGKGLLLVEKDILLRQTTQAAPQLTWSGTLAATNFQIEPRREWVQSETWWNQAYMAFRAQSALGDPNFPRWLQNQRGLTYVPRIRIEALQDGVVTQWFDGSTPLFLPHSGDASPLEAGNPGLRWEVLRMVWLDPQ